MKKTYQHATIEIGAQSAFTGNYTLRENYARCTGFLLAPSSGGTDFGNLQVGLNIGQQEILPQGCNACLFAMTEYVSRDEATYDITAENIAARSADVQVFVKNTSEEAQTFNVYFRLEN